MTLTQVSNNKVGTNTTNYVPVCTAVLHSKEDNKELKIKINVSYLVIQIMLKSNLSNKHEFVHNTRKYCHMCHVLPL